MDNCVIDISGFLLEEVISYIFGFFLSLFTWLISFFTFLSLIPLAHAILLETTFPLTYDFMMT